VAAADGASDVPGGAGWPPCGTGRAVAARTVRFQSAGPENQERVTALAGLGGSGQARDARCQRDRPTPGSGQAQPPTLRLSGRAGPVKVSVYNDSTKKFMGP
jgi:hypothetical protein